MKHTLISALACGLALSASSETSVLTESRIDFTKPAMRWLWGGFGFHNSEATMTPMMSREFRDQRVLKTFREISPSYSRVFAGYWNWTREAMDRFADYYDATFRRAGTTLYVVPGRMPVITEDFDAASYCEAVATRLEYLVKERKCTKIRYYCLSNELSVGPTYAWFAQHLDKYAEINREMHRAFMRHGLDIGLQTPDSSGYSRMADIDWAITNINEQTDTYCWHCYERNLQPGDPALYARLSAALTDLVGKALRKEKRLSLGEFGFTGKITPYGRGRMRDDGHDSFRHPGSEFARRAAISRAEMGLAALNAGAVSAVSWTMVDYPDPFLREDGDTPEEKARYDVARFSGFGLDVRYNKNGLFRWCDEERDYSSYPDLYTMGYLVKLFRKGARVLPYTTDDDTLRAGGVTNPNGTASFAIVNWGEAKKVTLVVRHPLDKPLRVYEYDSERPPVNPFNDLQPMKGTVSAEKGEVVVSVPARSLTFLTTDYEDRVPAAITKIRIVDGTLGWAANEEPEHRYYRVFKDGKQIASTVSTSFPVPGGKADDVRSFSVKSVDKWNNMRK
ncbi:MAG: hypothetical protein IKO72_07195 [Kiritimatiellae bacterium]|nr:hypothetical protein [Kiritimatiellia bacterium]